jgi:two-component system cell cycle response regulator DivK
MSTREVVLVVEDNEQNLELVEFLLEEAGIIVRKAMDAEAARREILREAPALVLMDMDLPGIDGLTLVAEFRAAAGIAGVPIVALTAHAMRGDRERFIQGGCDGYIAKPINVSRFIAEVRELIAAGRVARPAGGAP